MAKEDETPKETEEETEQNEQEEGTVIEFTKDDLSARLETERNEGMTQVLSTVNETLGTEFESVDDLSEQLSEQQIGNVEESDVVKDLQSKLSDAQEKINSYDQKMQEIRTQGKVKSEIDEQIGDKEFILPYEELKTLVDAKYGYVEKDGELYATQDGNRFLNDSGEYMKYSEAFTGYAMQRGLVKGDVSGGTGGGSNPTVTSGADNPFSKEGYNVTKQAQMFKEDPEKAKRLQREANNG